MENQATPAADPPLKPARTTFEAAGRSWSVKLTLGLCDELATATGVDLIPDQIDKASSEIVRLTTQLRLLGRVLWTLVGDQAPEGFTDKDFAKALDGDALEGGWTAVFGAVEGFIQRRSPAEAAALVKIVETELECIAAGAKLMAERIDGPEAQAILAEKREEIMSQALAELRGASVSSATS